jgi:hypothetical protein
LGVSTPPAVDRVGAVSTTCRACCCAAEGPWIARRRGGWRGRRRLRHLDAGGWGGRRRTDRRRAGDRRRRTGGSDPRRDHAGGADAGRAQVAKLLVEQHAFLVEHLAAAIEVDELLVELRLLLFQRGDLLLDVGAQLVQVVGGGITGRRPERQRRQRNRPRE